MTEKRIVPGLLDYAVAVARGEQVTAGLPSTGFAFGIGDNAGEPAIRTEGLDRNINFISDLTLPKNKSAGRPKKRSELKAENLRAFHLWLIAQDFAKSQKSDATVSELINFVKRNVDCNGKTKSLWTVGSAESQEQSVSRGKTFWGIDENWNSPKCDAFWDKHKP